MCIRDRYLMFLNHWVMKSNYKRLGNYIRQVDVRNRDLVVNKLLGLSIACLADVPCDVRNLRHHLLVGGTFHCYHFHVQSFLFVSATKFGNKPMLFCGETVIIGHCFT